MVEIKVYKIEEINPNKLIPSLEPEIWKEEDKDITHICIVTEGDKVLGTSAIHCDENEINLLNTDMALIDPFLLDGLIKTVVHYALSNKYTELVVYDEEALKYMEEKKVDIDNYSVDLLEFIHKTSCSHRKES